MKLSEYGFRPVYKNYCFFPMNDAIKTIVKDHPLAAAADGVLTYGYIDHEAGLTLELLALAKRTDNNQFSFVAIPDDVRLTLRIGAVIDEEFEFIGYTDNPISEHFKQRIEVTSNYDVNENIEKSRGFDFLDEYRSPEYPDDVLVLLVKQGFNPEKCWVRIEALGEACLIGILLDEPNQDYGYHKGEKIGFFLYEASNGEKALICNMNPSASLTKEDLADGSMLKNAISKYYEERNKERVMDIFEILRDSNVWIPFMAVFSETDQDMIEKMVNECEGNLDNLVGKTFSNTDNVRLIPDILTNKDKFYFPVFSSIEEMGEYGKAFSKVERHFLDAIKMARANDRKIEAIVINAFSESFEVPADFFEAIENLKSRLS